MRKNGIHHPPSPFSDRRWRLPFLASLLVSFSLLLAALFRLYSPPPYYGGSISFSGADDEDGESTEPLPPPADLMPEPPRIAYLITGTKGDSSRMRRTLMAIYHPRNQYILHLDLEAPPRERIELSMFVKEDPVFGEAENVRVIAKANLVTYKGPTMIACTLHAIAILLREAGKWDWFINLSASDYPLMTQDDLLHVFSSLPRDLNFIEHTQSTGWKVNQRAKPIIIDPGLHLSKKSELFVTNDRRELPELFQLFTGSAWVVLSRSFLEYCIWGWENLPRTVLMYYANYVSSPEGYFHTVICNSGGFRDTAVSHDLHYIAWDTPPKQHPVSLSLKDFSRMVKSGAPFARKFARNDPVLDKIDRELLGRTEGGFTPGAWCPLNASIAGLCSPSSVMAGNSSFVPGPGADRLKELMKVLLSQEIRNSSCTGHAFDKFKTPHLVPR